MNTMHLTATSEADRALPSPDGGTQSEADRALSGPASGASTRRRILLVDHVVHKTTGSFAFFRNLLATRHKVDVFYYERPYRVRLPKDRIAWADWVVFWEFLPWRYRLGVPGKKCLFVPMYDNEWGSVWQWRRIARSGMHVLSFSRRVSKHARACGVGNLLDVQFALDPARFPDMRGNPRKLLLWERGDVSFATVKSLFSPNDLDEVLVLRHPEEKLRHAAVSAEDAARYHVRIVETGFLPEAEYRELMCGPGLVLAPRFKEGIGMSFLEAMAMGKVVIAHNDATMNEVICSGENGWLADLRHPTRLDASALRALHARGFDRITPFAQWRKDEARILDYLDSATETFRPVRSPYLYARYLWEGLSMRLRPV